jgi:hypothetical protein
MHSLIIFTILADSVLLTVAHPIPTATLPSARRSAAANSFIKDEFVLGLLSKREASAKQLTGRDLSEEASSGDINGIVGNIVSILPRLLGGLTSGLSITEAESLVPGLSDEASTVSGILNDSPIAGLLEDSPVAGLLDDDSNDAEDSDDDCMGMDMDGDESDDGSDDSESSDDEITIPGLSEAESIVPIVPIVGPIVSGILANVEQSIRRR